jgi:hypothetical protein
VKNKIVNNFIWILFLAIGTAFLMVSLVLYKTNYIPKESREKTIATIINIMEYDDEHNVLISYKVNNQTYFARLDFYSSSYYEGKEIDIYYDINNLTKIMDTSYIVLFLIFFGVGTMFILIAIMLITSKLIRKRIMHNLKENGLLLNAQYLYVKTNMLYSVNNRHPFNIYCESSQLFDGKIHRFKSENIWDDPTKIINDKDIKYFKIYVNPKNYKQYYMDIDIVLENLKKDK